MAAAALRIHHAQRSGFGPAVAIKLYTDGDGDIDRIHAFGSRSVTIWNTDGTVVYTLVGRPNSFSPVAGGPGDASTITTTWSARGTAGLTRGTA